MRPGTVGSHLCEAGGRLGGTDHCSSDRSKGWNLEDVKWLLKGTYVHLKDTSASLSVHGLLPCGGRILCILPGNKGGGSFSHMR